MNEKRTNCIDSSEVIVCAGKALCPWAGGWNRISSADPGWQNSPRRCRRRNRAVYKICHSRPVSLFCALRCAGLCPMGRKKLPTPTSGPPVRHAGGRRIPPAQRFPGRLSRGYERSLKSMRQRAVKKEDALRLLSFCNQPGPAFLFGMVGPCLPERWMAWVLWGIILVSALFVSLLTRPGTALAELPPREVPTPAAAMGSALRVMGSVCGWVIIFRVAAAFLDRWALCFLPSVWKTAALGALELSNGCCMLCQIPDARVRFLLAAGMLSFGGLCVTMQTISLLDKLPIKTYLWGKALQTGFALALSCAAVYGHVWYRTVPAILAVILLCRKKAVAFSRKPLYNG